MPVPDDESSDDDEEDIFARPVEAVEAVWSDDDDETRRFATSPRARFHARDARGDADRVRDGRRERGGGGESPPRWSGGG